MPPFPRAPPLRLLAEPSVAGSCGHLLGAVDTSERAVRYPGGQWRYFAEWSGLDEEAAEEEEGYYYSYGGGEDGHLSYDGGGGAGGYPRGTERAGSLGSAAKAAAAKAANAAAKEIAARTNASRYAAPVSEPMRSWLERVRAAAGESTAGAGGGGPTAGALPAVFAINSDFSLAHGLNTAHMLETKGGGTAAAAGAASAAGAAGGGDRGGQSSSGSGGGAGRRRLDMPPTYIPTTTTAAAGSSSSSSGGGGSSGQKAPTAGSDNHAMSYDDEGHGGRHHRTRGEPSHAMRLRLMMANYRGARTLGVLENKLLAASAMSRLGMPTMEMIYGALAYTRLGEWPAYTRHGMYASLERGGYGPDRGFVAKPASDGTNFGLLVMTPERWKRENWSMPLVARHVERFLYKDRSSWGQWYEQRGVVIQNLYTDGAPRGLRWPHGLAEMNVLAHMGRPVHVRVMQIPKAHGTGCFDVRLHTNGSHECLPAPNCPDAMAVCGKYALRFAAVLKEVQYMVTRIASFFGSDWFRFDYFYGHRRAPSASTRSPTPRTTPTLPTCAVPGCRHTPTASGPRWCPPRGAAAAVAAAAVAAAAVAAAAVAVAAVAAAARARAATEARRSGPLRRDCPRWRRCPPPV